MGSSEDPCSCGDGADIDFIELEMTSAGFEWRQICLRCEWYQDMKIIVDWDRVEYD